MTDPIEIQNYRNSLFKNKIIREVKTDINLFDANHEKGIED